MPFFTVIIPLFNKENYVHNCIQSVFNQTFTNYEIIIVNDGSTDKSIAIVENFKNQNIKIINHDNNKGLSATRNTGIANANSDYITFLDADDAWKPTFLENVLELINTFAEARIFATNYEEKYQNKIVLPQNNANKLKKNSKQIIDFFSINLGQGIYNHGSVCFHKSVFKKAGLYNENIDYAEDLDFNIRANWHFKLAYSNTIGMQYSMQIEDQLTKTNIANIRLPDYDKYNDWAAENLVFKKYLDFERYVLSKHLKIDGNSILSEKIIQSINLKNLNSKQIFLLKSPILILKFVRIFKNLLFKLNIKSHSY